MLSNYVGVEEIYEIPMVESLHHFDFIENEFLLGLAGQIDVFDCHSLTSLRIQCNKHRSRSTGIKNDIILHGNDGMHMEQ